MNSPWRRWRRWSEQRQLRHGRISIGLWERVLDAGVDRYGLDRRELHRLRELASLFLHRKVIHGAGGQQVDDFMRAWIAAEACLLILNLDLADYDGWREILVYPGTFAVTREVTDDIGLVHEERSLLGGEAWGQGPVILAWDDARPGAHPHGEGSNVILHEFAHKLDMGNGVANGMPPLHPDMNRREWTRTFSRAYARLQQRLEHHHHTRIDPYAAESPAEFFAVVSEEFFEVPARLHAAEPGVYDLLRRYYRQDPLQRMCGTYTLTRPLRCRR